MLLHQVTSVWFNSHTFNCFEVIPSWHMLIKLFIFEILCHWNITSFCWQKVIFNTNLDLHSMHVKLGTAFRNQTVHLMDLDSSYGLFTEWSDTSKQSIYKHSKIPLLCATIMITLKEIQELKCATKILVTLKHFLFPSVPICEGSGKC